MRVNPAPRKLSRRDALKIGGGALLGAAVLGCGGSRDDQAGRTTLRFMTAQTREKHRSLEPLIAEFMEIHPGIRIEHVKVPWDQAHSKYLTAILGGAPPDVMTIPSWWVTEFRAMGALEDLGPWVRDWPHLQGYTEQVKRLTRATMAFDGGQVFGLPTEVAVRSMFYRTEWLDEHGLAPAETREEWRALLEQITDPARQRYGYALRGARGGFWSWWPIAQEFAGTNAWFDADHRCVINGPDHVAGLSYWNDLYQDGLAPPDSLNWGFNELVQGFWSGLCGTMEQDPEVVRTCLEHGLDEDTLAITVMPAGPRARVALSDGGYTSMSSASRHKDEAWTFLSWLMAPEQRLRYCKDVNMIPPFAEAMKDPAFGQGLYRSFVEMVSDPAIIQNWYPNYLPEMGEFLEVRVTEEHQKMLLKRQSPREALDRLADFLTRAQKKYVDRHGPDTPRPPVWRNDALYAPAAGLARRRPIRPGRRSGAAVDHAVRRPVGTRRRPVRFHETRTVHHPMKPVMKSRRYTRRDMLRLGGTAVAGAAVLGCGAVEDRRTVTVFSPMGEVKNRALARQADRFMALRGDLRVEVMPVPWDQGHAKLLTMIAGGNPPDVITATGQWMAEFRAMGAIEDLTPWFASWSHRDAFTRTALLRCESSTAIEDGRVYGLPLELTTRAMFYRKEWLGEQGLEPAETRAAWRTLLERITDRERGRYGYALRGARGGFWTWWPILEEFSGTNEWFDGDHNCIISSPAHVEGLAFWNDLYRDGLAPADSVNWGYNELVQGFWSGICGCIEQDPEVVHTCLEHGMDESTLVTAPMPAGPRAHVASNDIWILSISSGAKNPDGALAFYEWMMSPERLIAYSKEASVLPTVKQGMDDPWFGQGFLRPFMDMATDTKLLQNWYPSYLPEMGEFIEVLVTEEQQKMLLGRQSPRETLDRLADFLGRAQRRYVDRHGPDTPRPPRPSGPSAPSSPSEPLRPSEQSGTT